VILGYDWPNPNGDASGLEFWYTCCKAEDITVISENIVTNVTIHPSTQFVGPSSSCPAFLVESGCKRLPYFYSHEHACASPTAVETARVRGHFTSSYCAGCYPHSDCGYTNPNEALPEVSDTFYKKFDEDWSCVPMTLVSSPYLYPRFSPLNLTPPPRVTLAQWNEELAIVMVLFGGVDQWLWLADPLADAC